MRRLFWLGLVIVGAAAVGCSDTPPTGAAIFDAAAGSGGGPADGGPAGGGGTDGGAMAGNGGNDAGLDGPSAGGAGLAGTAGGGGRGGMAGGAGAMGPAGAGGTAGTAGAGGTGTAGTGGSPQLAPPAPIGLVALNSDSSATSLSILSTAGGLIQPNCVDSATGSGGGSSKTISGAATLPSQPQLGGQVVIVDTGKGALTFVDPSACTIARQLSVPGGAVTEPKDVVILSPDKAYVTRHGKNFAAADPTLAGNDVVVINSSTGALIEQIGLDAYASAVAGATILVRPDRALIVNGQVAVTLNEVDAGGANYGEGKLVVIDPLSDQVVASVVLPGLYGCEGMTLVAASHTLLVSCAGAPGAQDQPVQSGIAVVDLGVSPPSLVRSISSVAFDDRPLGTAPVVALPPTAGGTRGFAVTNDPDGVGSDTLFAFDYVLGTATKVATSDPHAFGRAAGAPGHLLVPDARSSMPLIELYDVSGPPEAKGGFASDPVTGLPPVEVAWY